MKNFLKRKRANKKGTDDTQPRITNETVAEHREKVLAGGRKFKYPLQYQKHKLVINSIIIGVGAVILLVVLGWHQLYVAQNSSKLMYRITQLLPVGVASVDGQTVPYSAYLMRYRSNIFYLQKTDTTFNIANHDGVCRAAYHQRRALIDAEKEAYVAKISRDLHITVTDNEISDFISKDTNSRSVSLNAYEKTVLNSYFDWSLDEYRSIVHGELLERKVSFSVDNEAKKRADDLLQSIKGGADFSSVAKTSSDDTDTKGNGGDAGVLPVTNLDSNGLVAVAKTLEVNQVSDPIQGIDGYYIIKLLSKDKDNVHYQFIKIGLTELDKRFERLKVDGKIHEFIKVDRADCGQGMVKS